MVLSCLLNDIAAISEDLVTEVAVEAQTEWRYHQIELFEEVEVHYCIIFQVLNVKPQEELSVCQGVLRVLSIPLYNNFITFSNELIVKLEILNFELEFSIIKMLLLRIFKILNCHIGQFPCL